MAKPRGRPPNKLETVSFPISTTPQVKAQLLQLVETGHYGKTETEAAEKLITQALERLEIAGRIQPIRIRLEPDEELAGLLKAAEGPEEPYDG